ncbi:hypothetical protein M408DRAFT_23121 [Serendipita vermifera MAFF 305830]|uniref:Uncharacterized protein n=1 Tax=Serendipita vermifera MAFF 305830 TaxID=933852 RepID=A0A0C2XJW8_SERVB|nr:hypothetical protein M408DRAFT_23121 [Serendipita vermifera MAFF 305830]
MPKILSREQCQNYSCQSWQPEKRLTRSLSAHLKEKHGFFFYPDGFRAPSVDPFLREPSPRSPTPFTSKSTSKQLWRTTGPTISSILKYDSQLTAELRSPIKQEEQPAGMTSMPAPRRVTKRTRRGISGAQKATIKSKTSLGSL